MRYFAPKALLAPPVMRAGYSDRMAWVMANLAALAYIRFETGALERKRLEKALAAGGFGLLATFHDPATGTQGYLAENETYAALNFRGTEKNGRDILTDLDARFTGSDSDGRRHNGFARAYRGVRADIRQLVDQTVGDDWPLYIGGHSLGGALAGLAAQDLERDNLAATYTFDAPRIGDAEFTRALKSPVFAIINGCSIVPRVPLMAMGYVRLGDIRYIDSAGRMNVAPNQVRLAWDFAIDWARDRGNPFKRHRIKGDIIPRLKAIALERT